MLNLLSGTLKAALIVTTVVSSNSLLATTSNNEAPKFTSFYLDIYSEDGMNKYDAEFIVNHREFLTFAKGLDNKSWAVRDTEDKYIRIFNRLLGHTNSIDIRQLVQCNFAVCMGSFAYENELEMTQLFEEFTSSNEFNGALVSAFVDGGVANFIFNYKTSVLKTSPIE